MVQCLLLCFKLSFKHGGVCLSVFLKSMKSECRFQGFILSPQIYGPKWACDFCFQNVLMYALYESMFRPLHSSPTCIASKSYVHTTSPYNIFFPLLDVTPLFKFIKSFGAVRGRGGLTAAFVAGVERFGSRARREACGGEWRRRAR